MGAQGRSAGGGGTRRNAVGVTLREGTPGAARGPGRRGHRPQGGAARGEHRTRSASGGRRLDGGGHLGTQGAGQGQGVCRVLPVVDLAAGGSIDDAAGRERLILRPRGQPLGRAAERHPQVPGHFGGRHGTVTQGVIVQLAQKCGRQFLRDIQDVGQRGLLRFAEAADVLREGQDAGEHGVGDARELHECHVRDAVRVLPQHLLDARRLNLEEVGLAVHGAVVIAAGVGAAHQLVLGEFREHGAGGARREPKRTADLGRRQCTLRGGCKQIEDGGVAHMSVRMPTDLWKVFIRAKRRVGRRKWACVQEIMKITS